MSPATRFCRLVLQLYPKSVRLEFGDEMQALVMARLARERAARPRWAGLRTCWFVVRDASRALPQAYAGSIRDGRRLPGREVSWFMLGDLRFALRSLRRSRGFATAAILTLALGIGSTTAIFSVVNGVILEPLPYHQPDALLRLGATRASLGSTMDGMSGPDILDIQNEVQSLEAVAGFADDQLTLTGLGDAEAVRGARVTRGLLGIFRQAPTLGRDIRADENIPNGPRVAIVGHAFWEARLGADSDVLGRTIQVDGESFEVIGVAPPGFEYPADTEVWIPLYQDTEDCGRGCRILEAVARLADGSALGTAQNELASLSVRLQDEFPRSNFEQSLEAVTLKEYMVGDLRTPLLALLAAIAMVLLIACTNVANLLLARASARTGEMATRRALGAGSGRLVQQLLLEALVLSFFAGVGGITLAFGGVTWLHRLAPANLPRLENVTIDGAGLLFAVVTVLVIAALFGVLPALRLTRASLSTVLHQRGRGGHGSDRQGWTRSALVMTEVAVSLMLLFGAGLLLRSFNRLSAVELGFETQDVLTFEVALPDMPYADGDRAVHFFETLEAEIAGLPGVAAVGSAFGSPLGRAGAHVSADFLDRPEPPPGQAAELNTRIITPRYHEVLQVPLLEGRRLEPRDRNGVPRAALVSQSLVDRYYADKDPIGQQIRLGWSWGYGSEEPWTVVGVVADIRSEQVSEAPESEIYLSQAQMGATFLTVLVRTVPNTPDVLPGIRRVVQAIDPNVPLRRVEMLDESADRQFGPTRFYLTLFSIFSVVAVILTAIGLYGVIAYLVSRRTREIGVRVALGASGGDIVRMILGQGLRPAALGIVLGLAGAFWGSRALQSMLYEVGAGDPLTFAGVTALLLVVILFALLVPAGRASRVSPTDALKLE